MCQVLCLMCSFFTVKHDKKLLYTDYLNHRAQYYGYVRLIRQVIYVVQLYVDLRY